MSVIRCNQNKKQESLDFSRDSVAEREGFEPSHGNYPPAGIRSQSLQPLGYLSTASVIIAHSLNGFQGFICQCFAAFARL